jgi:hypothetical protein
MCVSARHIEAMHVVEEVRVGGEMPDCEKLWPRTVTLVDPVSAALPEAESARGWLKETAPVSVERRAMSVSATRCNEPSPVARRPRMAESQVQEVISVALSMRRTAEASKMPRPWPSSVTYTAAVVGALTFTAEVTRALSYVTT